MYAETETLLRWSQANKLTVTEQASEQIHPTHSSLIYFPPPSAHTYTYTYTYTSSVFLNFL
jgi:hypothetical protein